MITTIQQLEAAYPELVTQLRVDAVSRERARVAVHLRFGRKSGFDSGGMRRALEAIESGEPMTEKLMETYFSRGEAQAAIDARQEDSDAAGAALGGGRPQSAGDSALAREIDRQLGAMS